MAMNPMQRRARNSFLVGFLVALIVMALVVLVLLNRIKSINSEMEALKSLQKTYLVASSDLTSGQEVKLTDNFTSTTVQTTVDPSKVISDIDFQFTDKNGEQVTKYNDDGSEKTKKVIMKIDVPAGTIVTKDMIVEYDEQTTDTDRVREFNMVSLPSQLKNGDYIDIRISLPNGQDYIVLSKKKVLGTNATGIWLQLNELELELMNSAIVESYMMTGSKLYALEYVEPGMQKSSIPTYVASIETMALMAKNPNIVNDIYMKYYDSVYENLDSRTNYIQPEVDKNKENQNALVSAGNSSEREAIKTARQEYVSSLEGTEDIGYTEDNN